MLVRVKLKKHQHALVNRFSAVLSPYNNIHNQLHQGNLSEISYAMQLLWHLFHPCIVCSLKTSISKRKLTLKGHDFLPYLPPVCMLRFCCTGHVRYMYI